MTSAVQPIIRLDVFDGPLDLLLYLVQHQELDPRRIRLSEVADQYAAYLAQVGDDQLGLAGEYLVMAVRLLALKARELLPHEERGPEDELDEGDIDREELVRQLLEYRRFKVAAEGLRSLEARHFGALPRGRPDLAEPAGEGVGRHGIWELLAAFRRVLAVRPREPVHGIELDEVSLEECVTLLRARLVREGRIHFSSLSVHDGRRIATVVFFIASLELVKIEEAVLRQSRTFAPIVLFRKCDSDHAEEMARDWQEFDPDPEFVGNIAALLEAREQARADRVRLDEEAWEAAGAPIDYHATQEVRP